MLKRQSSKQSVGSSKNLLGSGKNLKAGPSGMLSVRGMLSSSSRWCSVELDKQTGSRLFVLRKGGADGSVDRRVLLSQVQELVEVGEKEFKLVGTADGKKFEVSLKTEKEAGATQPTPRATRSRR